MNNVTKAYEFTVLAFLDHLQGLMIESSLLLVGSLFQFLSRRSIFHLKDYYHLNILN